LEIHGRTATAAVLSLWWQALLQYDLAAVQAAMSAYLADPVAGRYPPVPAAGLLAWLQISTEVATLLDCIRANMRH
jgi:hypothetical protein